MDFTKYSNINKKVKKFGGVKKALFNSERLEEAEKSWEQFLPEELEIIDKEFPTALQVFSSVITSKALCVYDAHTFTAIPVKDILWVYCDILTQKLNFIPYSKIHSIMLLARDGKRYNIGSMTTGGFTKKMPANEKIEQIHKFLEQYRKGIVYGYDNDLYQMFSLNFGKAIEMLDKM